ncbi:hypothetical protein [Sulfurimonas sp.]|uniref:hypothetical protein n=1 Tax=Sulfurimonas sp. TaxID=2022749 RepID=UPI0035663E2F
MRFKSLITLTLLFVISFSIVHEYVYAAFDTYHTSVHEYVSEFDTPTSHEDLCDIHFEYHQSFLLSQNLVLPDIDFRSTANKTDKETYNFKTHLELYKPPVS